MVRSLTPLRRLARRHIPNDLLRSNGGGGHRARPLRQLRSILGCSRDARRRRPARHGTSGRPRRRRPCRCASDGTLAVTTLRFRTSHTSSSACLLSLRVHGRVVYGGVICGIRFTDRGGDGRGHGTAALPPDGCRTRRRARGRDARSEFGLPGRDTDIEPSAVLRVARHASLASGKGGCVGGKRCR